MDQNETRKTVFISCRRGSLDVPGTISGQSSDTSANRSCDSKTAYLQSAVQPNTVGYQCTKCGYTWMTPIGGGCINL
jgi:hypothetical protein